MSSQSSYQVAFVPDNFIPVIPVDGDLEHTDLYPFCCDPACDCHNDDEAIAAVVSAVQAGIMTDDEAADFILGKLL